MRHADRADSDGAQFDYVDAISEHSAGFADAADANLDAVVEHCPGWVVANLVQHLTAVHWFWATIVEERLSEPPEDERRPAAVERGDLIAMFRTGAARLVDVLLAADQRAPVYTWAPAQRDVAFITRHQVQEVAVHHWDAVHAAGDDLVIEAPVAVDAITEFLTFSVSCDADPAEPARPALDGRFALRCGDADTSWTVWDGRTPGTVAYEHGARAELPGVLGTSSDLLLWLYGRVDLDTSAVPAELIGRFQALCYTD